MDRSYLLWQTASWSWASCQRNQRYLLEAPQLQQPRRFHHDVLRQTNGNREATTHGFSDVMEINQIEEKDSQYSQCGMPSTDLWCRSNSLASFLAFGAHGKQHARSSMGEEAHQHPLHISRRLPISLWLHQQAGLHFLSGGGQTDGHRPRHPQGWHEPHQRKSSMGRRN